MNRTFARGKDPMYPAVYKFYVSIFSWCKEHEKPSRKTVSLLWIVNHFIFIVVSGINVTICVQDRILYFARASL